MPITPINRTNYERVRVAFPNEETRQAELEHIRTVMVDCLAENPCSEAPPTSLTTQVLSGYFSPYATYDISTGTGYKTTFCCQLCYCISDQNPKEHILSPWGFCSVSCLKMYILKHPNSKEALLKEIAEELGSSHPIIIGEISNV